jgi:hypothetical protein
MGDGFLGVFRTIPAAFSLALRFLETPLYPNVPIRMALHWGAVKIVPNKDVFGMEVHKILRIDLVKIQDRVEPATPQEAFPEADRILATQQAMKRLHDSDKRRFRLAGKFCLQGFDDSCELWILHK